MGGFSSGQRRTRAAALAAAVVTAGVIVMRAAEPHLTVERVAAFPNLAALPVRTAARHFPAAGLLTDTRIGALE